MRNGFYCWPTFVVATLAIALTGSAALGGTIYTGSLTNSDMTTTSAWNTGVNLSWTVQEVSSSPDLWHYSYSFTVPSKNISHFILEMGNVVTSADIQNCLVSTDNAKWTSFVPTSSDLTNFSAQNGDPGMPEPMHGLKISGTATSMYFQFDTEYAPTWGDFYSKSGKSDGVFVTAWNNGFTSPDVDTVGRLGNGSLNGEILVPGSESVPEPATASLLGFGVLGLIRRRKTAKA